MSFQPVIPIGGLAGWAFLNKTRERQEASFTAAPAVKNDLAHFRQNFAAISSTEDLVKDRRSFRVILSAYGLEDDINSGAFIRKIIDDGVDDRKALANRLTDRRYKALAQDLGFLTAGSKTVAPGDLKERIAAQFQSRSFERAVGAQNQDMRMALALQRELPDLVQGYASDNAQWFAVLGNAPMRKVMETALGLPKEFGALDVDQQVVRLKSSVSRRFNVSNLQALSEPENMDKLIKRFLVMSQIREMQVSMSPASVALTLLRR
ncbi:DUF1217 domain-containing protein [Roseinatronobacter alkalisoli]|uniref:DUF1217 domain-containing protein n=1 Tax=Roseinatronobacter alkalisoli TaxID=3028235 RepID=A0ABT5T9D5_9RHOB|nr:DUF1217 domain-containing protein [Roseinatronobacter sp. HJB301]MDD7971729.1 DUF1217 domain-containing protein [Roseinatronobacter sp. HJB301]